MSRRAERGSVAAELVVALPAVALVLGLCLGGMRVGMQAVAVQDAAAVAARSLARGDSESAAAGRAATAAPGARVSASRRDGLVCVTARAPSPIGALPLPLTATACALEGPT